MDWKDEDKGSSWRATIKTYWDVPDRKLGSMVRINGLFHLLINGVYWGYFLVHPSMQTVFFFFFVISFRQLIL